MEEASMGETGSRGFRDIVRDLQHEAVLLLRGEMALVRSEMSEKTGVYKKGTRNAIIGGVVTYTGALLFLAGLTCLFFRALVGMGMQNITAMWVAPLVLGIIVLIIGGVMLNQALRHMKDETLVPEKSIDSLKEDKQWAQRKVA